MTAIWLIARPSLTGSAGPPRRTRGRPLGRRVRGQPPAGRALGRASRRGPVRFRRPGRTLQFNGHLDTVHLPLVPRSPRPHRAVGRHEGGIAAAEAMRAVRDAGGFAGGGILHRTTCK